MKHSGSNRTGGQLRRPLGSLGGARRPRGRGRARSPRAGSCGDRWAASAAPGDREAGDALDRHGLAAAAPAGQPRRRPATARQGTRSIATGWQLRRPLGSLDGARRPRGRGRARSPRAGSCGDRWAASAAPGDREAGDALDRHGLAAAAPAGQPRRRPATARQGTRSIATGWQLRRPLGSLDGARRPRGRGRARSPRAGSCGARWAASAAPGDREAGDALDRHGLAAAATAGPAEPALDCDRGARQRLPRAGRACPRLRSRGTPAAPERSPAEPCRGDRPGPRPRGRRARSRHPSGRRRSLAVAIGPVPGLAVAELDRDIPAVAGGALPWQPHCNPSNINGFTEISTASGAPSVLVAAIYCASANFHCSQCCNLLRQCEFPLLPVLQSIAPVRISTAPSAAIYCASANFHCSQCCNLLRQCEFPLLPVLQSIAPVRKPCAISLRFVALAPLVRSAQVRVPVVGGNGLLLAGPQGVVVGRPP